MLELVRGARFRGTCNIRLRSTLNQSGGASFDGRQRMKLASPFLTPPIPYLSCANSVSAVKLELKMKPLAVSIVLLVVTGLAAELALVQPKDVAAELAAKGTQPVVIQVGPNMLYRAKRIPGALYAGPGGKPEGLELLKQAVAKLPHDREIILYCGCCPWNVCPNMKPAMALLQQLGFTHAKALVIETNFAKDWTEKGYPVEAGAAK